MAGRTPADAFREFRKPIQEAIACFAHTRVTGSSQEPDEPGVLAVNWGQPLSLKATGRQVDITCSIDYTILQTSGQDPGNWRVSTNSYIHTVRLDGELVVNPCH